MIMSMAGKGTAVLFSAITHSSGSAHPEYRKYIGLKQRKLTNTAENLSLAITHLALKQRFCC
jgi:hypothetical protein